MTDLYSELKKLSGRNCFTLTQNRSARMYIDDQKVTIVYPSGNSKEIPRSMVIQAIHKLERDGMLTLEDVHYGITDQNGPLTDRLLAVLRELPGVEFTPTPRALYLKTKL